MALISCVVTAKCVQRLLHRVSQRLAQRLRLWSVLSKRQIQFKRARTERLDVAFLGRKKPVGRANQGSKYQGEQQAEEPDYRTNHVSRACGHMAFGHEPLEIKPKKPEAKRQDAYSDRNNEARHGYPPTVSRAAAGTFSVRRVRGEAEPCRLRPALLPHGPRGRR